MAGDLNACMSIIRLLALQCQLLKHSATRVVNLTHEEAAAFVRSCNKYAEVIKYSPSVNQSVNIFIGHSALVAIAWLPAAREIPDRTDAADSFLCFSRKSLRYAAMGAGCTTLL